MEAVKILITGSSGFLGRATAELFAKDSNYEIFRLGRQNPIQENYIYSNLAKESFTSLKNKISINFDAIIHLAALTDFSKNFDAELFQINTIATSFLADIASERRIRFIFASTATVVGSRKICINSKLTMQPDSNYALSKWLAEHYLIAKLKYPLILRFGGIFGFNGPSHLALNKSITEILTKRKIPTIYGLGKAKRNYIYVKDVARMIKFGLENNKKGIHFIAGTEILSIEQMVTKICDLYIPGSLPIRTGRRKIENQIIEPSKDFPSTLNFEDALRDIQSSYLQTNKLLVKK